MLNEQVGTVVLHRLRWHGRVFDVEIGPRRTVVAVDSGAPLPVKVGSGKVRRVSAGATLVLRTRRPDRAPTADALRCATATASTANPGAPALAAVDGSPATQWEAASLPASLTVPLGGTRRVDRATVRWGHAWPGPPKPNVPPPSHPVRLRRATDYVLLGSADGRHWRRLAAVHGRAKGAVDRLHFPPASVRFLRIRVTAATKGIEGAEEPPLLQELAASG
jgi:hypothetical protein